jgi:hypothetical protein
MWLHIRGVGQWTNRLYEYFEREQEKLHNGDIAPLAGQSSKKRLSNGSIDNNNQNPLKKIQATITRDAVESRREQKTCSPTGRLLQRDVPRRQQQETHGERLQQSLLQQHRPDGVLEPAQEAHPGQEAPPAPVHGQGAPGEVAVDAGHPDESQEARAPPGVSFGGTGGVTC